MASTVIDQIILVCFMPGKYAHQQWDDIKATDFQFC